MPKKRREPITAYPKDYWKGYKRPVQSKSEYRNSYLEGQGWCLECKARPCMCPQESGSLFDRK